VDEARFRAMIAAGEFAEHAVVHGHLYGTRASAIERASSLITSLLVSLARPGRQKVYRRPQAPT